MTVSFHVIIPARYASTRLPGKPLLDIGGKPMLQHVYERACASGAEEVIIATDDARVAETARAFGATVEMTRATHQSGTDRLAEVVARRQFAADTIIVNLQGDEPLMPPVLIRQVAEDLAAHSKADLSTLCVELTAREAVFDPHVVKVVRDKRQFALYFSRAPIPLVRDSEQGSRHLYWRHVGLYAYRADYLAYFSALPVCSLEADEALEQLRALYDGGRIYVGTAAEEPGHGVDTPTDLTRVRTLLGG